MPSLCDPMNCSTPGFPSTVSQSLLKFMSIELGDNLEGYKCGRAGDNVGNYCAFLSALLELDILFAVIK